MKLNLFLSIIEIGRLKALKQVLRIIGAGFYHHQIRWLYHFRIYPLGVVGRRGDQVYHTAETYIRLILGKL